MTVRSRAAAPVQLMLHAPRAGSARPTRASGLFFLGDERGRTPSKNSPEVSRRREDPARPRAACPPRAPMGIPRAAVSPCRVLQSIDWEGEQALLELTLVDASHCDRVRTDQARQRQGAMVDPSRRHHQLSGDVR